MSEYAPLYTKKERVILILKHASWALPAFLLIQFVFFPWFEQYVEHAHCYHYGLVTGIELVMYFIFVGLPVLSALLIFATQIRRTLRIFSIAQNPLPDEKVYKKTKYKFGFKAKIQPIIGLLLLLCLLGLGIRGVFWANNIIDEIKIEPTECLQDSQ